ARSNRFRDGRAPRPPPRWPPDVSPVLDRAAVGAALPVARVTTRGALGPYRGPARRAGAGAERTPLAGGISSTPRMARRAARTCVAEQPARVFADMRPTYG